jgi:trans-aconitate 2-methyltransferase
MEPRAGMQWDPAQYARYSDERARPFFDLTRRIGAEAPGTVLDLGCGSGELTATLKGRWPEAAVRGVDASAEMIAASVADVGVSFTVGTAQDLDATGTDVLVSNAALQWVPGHERLLGIWAGQLNPKGWLAFQVPSNFDAPSHRLMRELAESSTWRGRLGGVLRGADSVSAPAAYLALLAHEGMRVDAWQTEYLHVLQGDDPVLEWVRGTGLRPVLAALPQDEASAFTRDYAALLREAYPANEYGTVFGFLRTFVVAQKL